MKRDLGLARRILLETERAERSLGLDELTKDGCYTVAQVAYHVEMMEHHGLLDARVLSDVFRSASKGFVRGLTWDGADFRADRDGAPGARGCNARSGGAFLVARCQTAAKTRAARVQALLCVTPDGAAFPFRFSRRYPK